MTNDKNNSERLIKLGHFEGMVLKWLEKLEERDKELHELIKEVRNEAKVGRADIKKAVKAVNERTVRIENRVSRLIGAGAGAGAIAGVAVGIVLKLI